MSALRDLQVPASSADATPEKFPASPYDTAGVYFSAYAQEITRATSSVQPTALTDAATALVDAYTRRATVFSCGNGGSAAVANHLQCDHVKGIRTTTGLAPRVVSLSTNIELLTAIANDMTYEDVFAYQLQSQSAPDDVLIAISSSGRSPNIVRALRWAREHGMRTIALTGFDGGDARILAEIPIHVHSANYGVVEDMHQTIMHTLAQYIRQSQMKPYMISSSIF